MWKIQLYKLHKRFGLTLAILVICWGLSGIAHPIMSRIKPMAQVPVKISAIDFSKIAIEKLLLPEHKFASEVMVIADNNGSPVLATKRDSKTWHYFDLASGQQLENFATEQLAANALLYTGLKKSQIHSIEQIDQFSFEYPKVNRHLPAYKVSFNDSAETQIYFDAQTLEFVSISNVYKATFSQWFSYLHSWSFINNKTLRYSLMLTFLILLFTSALFGLILAITKLKSGQIKKGNKKRVAHRYIGLAVSLAALAFSFSGAFHAASKLFEKTPIIQLEKPNLNLAVIKKSLSSEQLKQRYKGKTIARIQWHSASDKLIEQAFELQRSKYGLKIKNILYPNGEQEKKLVLKLFEQQTLANLDSMHLLTHYNPEYGFIDKRLPVYRIKSGEKIFFLEPSSSKIVKEMDLSRTLESYSFSFLHKARFLDGLGTNIRDIIIILFVFGIVFLVILGVLITYKRK